MMLTKADSDRLTEILAEILEILEGLMDRTQDSARDVAQRAKQLKQEFRGIKSRGSSSSSSERRPPSSESRGRGSSSESTGSFSDASGGSPVVKDYEANEIERQIELGNRFLAKAASVPANFSENYLRAQNAFARAERLRKESESRTASHKDDVRDLVESALAMRREDSGLSRPAADARRRRREAN